jgi:hypothetical protein
MSTWLERKLRRQCARKGCEVVLPEDAEHCLCDVHAAEARLATRVSMRRKRHGELWAWAAMNEVR